MQELIKKRSEECESVKVVELTFVICIDSKKRLEECE